MNNNYKGKNKGKQNYQQYKEPEYVKRIKDGEKIYNVLNPAEYVFKEAELVKDILKTNVVTKTQLRKYYNAYKSIHNNMKANPDLTEDEFEILIKTAILTIPSIDVLVHDRKFTRELKEIVSESLKKIYKETHSDFEEAKKEYVSFVEFYETLIAIAKKG